eukprot:scaffold7296_cov45-Phaeocystis_antarctica.AAC.1
MAAGPDAPLAARHFDALVRRGAEASVPREGLREKKIRRASGACECGAFTRYMVVEGGGDPRGLFSPELGRAAAEGPLWTSL